MAIQKQSMVDTARFETVKILESRLTRESRYSKLPPEPVALQHSKFAVEIPQFSDIRIQHYSATIPISSEDGSKECSYFPSDSDGEWNVKASK